MRAKQYTLRGISPDLDKRLRDEVKRTGKSLNAVAILGLEQSFLSDRDRQEYDDMDDLIGTWDSDPACEEALESMRAVEPDLWK